MRTRGSGLGYSSERNVSHCPGSPEVSPRLNQRTRCAEVPCVKDSGRDASLRLALQPVVADRARRR